MIVLIDYDCRRETAGSYALHFFNTENTVFGRMTRVDVQFLFSMLEQLRTSD